MKVKEFFRENYIRFFVWLGAYPPPEYKYLLQTKQEKHFSRLTKINDNKQTTLERNSTHSIRNLLYEAVYEFIEDVIPPIKTLLATFLVFLAFLLTDQILLWIFNLTTQDVQRRNPILGFFLEGIEFFSAISISIYFVISGIGNLRFQWKFSQRMEKQVDLR